MRRGAWLSLVPTTDDNNNNNIPRSSSSSPTSSSSSSSSSSCSSTSSSTTTSPTRTSDSSETSISIPTTNTFIPFKKANKAHQHHNHDHHPSPNSFLKTMVLEYPPRRKKHSSITTPLSNHKNNYHILPLMENSQLNNLALNLNHHNHNNDPRSSSFEVRSLQVCDIEKVRELHCTSLPVTYPRSFFYNLLSSSPSSALSGEGEKISLVATLPSTNGHGYFDTIGGVHSVHHHQPGCSTHQQYSHLGHHHVTSPLSGRKPISLDVIGSITARISPGTPTSVRILTLCVSPDYRRFGVGKLLLDNLLKQIKHRFSRLSTLSSTTNSTARKVSVNLHVQATNLVAHSFYKRAGFTTVGFKPSYYSDNELRPLDPAMKIIHSSSPTNTHSSASSDHHSDDPFNQQISSPTTVDRPNDIDAWFLELSFDST
ncbi:hypothetical protein MJO29_012050 [Puccinia striiformis f. sp. tritici]|nr:hypothetical protein Pst134EB_023598 [Puccinia striiformis f. sp. tritici]KAI7945662.1 hypothetical protein MJO29_012050 [Puccinia striiformis f. sp. tritici]KAI9612219.1 hypothetical protein KEM48_004234 [Puccinia striiformis f. sp. tritici PST-130]